MIVWRGDEEEHVEQLSGLQLAATWVVLLGCCALFWYSVIMAWVGA